MIVRIIVPEEFGRHNMGRVTKIPSPRSPHGEYAIEFEVETFVIHQPLRPPHEDASILIDCRVDTSALDEGVDSPPAPVLTSEARRESRFESGSHEPGSDAPGTR